MYGETVTSYIPGPMPPEPPVDLTEVLDLLDVANQAVGRLDGISNQIPDKILFLYCYVRREALMSSQIEGTQSSLVDLLLVESNEEPEDAPAAHAEEVSQYIRAIHYGLARMESDLPLSLRLIKEMHGVLLASGRGSHLQPGEFRTSQNWIGGDRPGNAIYVPPPPDQLMDCLDAFERFLHFQRRDLPVLVQTAMIHAQFESIHPFLDGNGRIGRLLVTLFLCMRGVLKDPLLYPSHYLKQNRTRYYELLQKIRHEGAWEEWIRFFLHAVIQAAEHAIYSVKRLLAIRERDRAKVAKLGRAAPNALKLYDLVCHHPVLSIPFAARKLELSHQTCSKLFLHLVALGILHGNDRQRGRIFRYSEFVAILAEGTEPLKAVL
ncbi:MAG: Fic family protein [Acidobacteria bacterium]|nr:Fic family protein [Acidobacteriota bacterium]